MLSKLSPVLFFSNGDPVIRGGQGCQVQGRNPLWNLNPHAFYNPPSKAVLLKLD
jgi:hypothetical protein